MEPIGVRVSSGTYRVLHRCEKCGFIRAQDSAKEDNPELLVELSAQPFTEPTIVLKKENQKEF